MTHFFPTAPRRRALPAVATALLLAAAAVPAHAVSGDARPGDWLRLTVTRGTGQSGETRSAVLLCAPPQGHSRAAEACGQLAAADGDPARLAPRPGAICAMLYAPVTARASGRWGGQPVEFSQTYGNDCELEALTGAVFALDKTDAGDGTDLAGGADAAGVAGLADLAGLVDLTDLADLTGAGAETPGM
ncbi:SSI family serine proteinase inhibitor [Streptomyces antibioticus]|uniref:SSI family serine proteinase inhibitor n=1 Tax=Streptomyces antibioticus TaxID=1890 RepID=UPI000996F0CA|nr:SSI family serine proteinase inhibitor [Streptomyces antibioticus]